MPLPSEHASLRAVIPSPRGSVAGTGTSRRPRPPQEADGALRAAVDSARRTLRDRPGPLPAALLDAMTERLRWASRVDPSGTSARASVHVACAHLATGDLEEGFLALEQAAEFLPGADEERDPGTGGGVARP